MYGPITLPEMDYGKLDKDCKAAQTTAGRVEGDGKITKDMKTFILEKYDGELNNIEDYRTALHVFLSSLDSKQEGRIAGQKYKGNTEKFLRGEAGETDDE